MSVYRVVIDGVDIYDPTRKELTLINPVLTVEMGSAGNFEFTMPPTHIFYNNITPYGSNIDVYEDGMLIWSGRPLNPVKDFWNQKRFHCEGCLAYLNDTIQTARDITGTTADYLRSFIAIHNSQESRNDRKFVVRNIAHDYVNSNRTIELNLESTFEAIRKYTIGVEGGYLFATKSSDGIIYLDWYDTAPYTCNQKVQFAINMVDITRTDDYDEFFTGVYAIGGQDPDTKQTISLSNVLWASNELRQKYGDIVKRVQFKDCITTNALYAAAQDYLNKHIVPDYIIEAEAADLHFLEGQHERFEVGMMVQVLSEPHLINGMYPLSRIVCYLDTGRKVITLGTLKRQTLTTLQEKVNNRLDDSDIPGDPYKPPEKRDPPDPFGDYDGWQRNEPGDPWHPVIDGVPSELDENGNYQPVPNEYPYITGGDGNDYVMGVDPSGGPGGSPAVTFDKVLNYIKISTTHEGVYHENDSFDLSEYTVAGYYGDGTSIDVTSRCEYAPTDGQTLLFMNDQPVFKWLVAQLTDYGRQFMDRMDLPYSDKIPASIHIVILPVKLEYEDGETIDYSGIAVELWDEDGNLFTDSKYPDGFIPFNELIFPITVASGESGGKSAKIPSYHPQTNAWNLDNPDHFSYPIVLGGSSGTVHRSYSTGEYDETYSATGEGRIYSYTEIMSNGSYLEPIFVSDKPFTSTRTFKGIEYIRQTTVEQIGGKTYYCVSGAGGIGNDGATSFPTNNVNDQSSAHIRDIVKLVFNGDIIETENEEIPVQWMRTDGETLEDTFIIMVKNII